MKLYIMQETIQDRKFQKWEIVKRISNLTILAYPTYQCTDNEHSSKRKTRDLCQIILAFETGLSLNLSEMSMTGLFFNLSDFIKV